MHDSVKLTETIARCHRVLGEVFLLHQEAVLLRDFDAAVNIWDYFKSLHHLHMVFEDQQLIPKLGALNNRQRWPALLYTAEHTKIQALMIKVEDDLQLLGSRRLSDRKLRRTIIFFLDKEKTLKGLCEHHQEREEAGILPELDKQTDIEWRNSIIAPFLKEWDDLLERGTVTIDGLTLPDRIDSELKFG